MKLIDFTLSLLLPSLILLHLLVAPYTKVEESFNIQATHDILQYGTPLRNVSARLQSAYDHSSFPGVVPRTFIGPVLLAGVSRPMIAILGSKHAQFTVRAVLSLFNAWTLHRYKKGVQGAFGRDPARWFVLLMAGQFHVLFYASRTLPNMFAFGVCTLALRELLPFPPNQRSGPPEQRYQLAIYLFVLAGVIFRSELAILLGTQVLLLLFQRKISLRQVIISGLVSAVIALGFSVPVDSYFWQRPIWPELAGFYFNAIQGKSTDWGTSPFHYYFTSSLPKLLLNPLVPTVLIPLSICLPSSRHAALQLLVPPLAFMGIYSIQPHKEARFIIYVVPPLTCAAAIGASYIYTRRSRTLIYRLFSLLLVGSVFLSLGLSTVMLLISSTNYAGGEALTRLHTIVEQNATSISTLPSQKRHINVHIDVYSCMTGVTRFIENAPVTSNTTEIPDSQKIQWIHSKVEDPEALLTPEFWDQFDYVLTSSPERVIGSWEPISTIYGISGHLIQKGYSGIQDVENTEPGSSLRVMENKWGFEVEKILRDRGWRGILEMGTQEWIALYEKLREAGRKYTKGWWVGPRFEAKVWILERIHNPHQI